MEEEFSGPLRSALGAVLASGDSSLDEFLDLSGIPQGDTPDDLERAFDERYGITIVDGRLILDGDVDVSSIKTLARMLGGLSGIYDKFPFLGDHPVDDDLGSSSFVEAPSFPIQLLVVFSRHISSTIPETFPPVSFTDEEVLGVDVSLSSILDLPGVVESEVITNVFWLGQSSPVASARRKMRSLGLPGSYFVDAVSGSSSSSLVVNTIPNPLDIPRFSAAFGSSADAVLQRVTRPLSLFPDPSDAAEAITRFIQRSTPGGAGSSGVQDFSSPTSALMSVLDIGKTFNIDEFSDSLGVSTDPDNLPATQFAEGISKSIKTNLAVSNAMMAEFQSAVSGPLNSMLSLQSVANSLLNDPSGQVMNCVLGAGFSPSFDYGVPGVPSIGAGTPGIPGVTTASALESALSTIENKVDFALSFLDGVSGVTGALQGVSCTGSFLSGSNSLTPSLPSFMPCAAERQEDLGFSLPPFHADSLGVAKIITDTLTSVASSFRLNIRMMKMQMVSMRSSIRDTVFLRGSSGSTSLPGIPDVPGLPGIPDIPASPSLPGGSLPGGGCAAPAASLLSSLLRQRSLEGFTPT